MLTSPRSRTFYFAQVMSALPPKADICGRSFRSEIMTGTKSPSVLPHAAQPSSFFPCYHFIRVVDCFICLLICFIFHGATVRRVLRGEAVNTEIFVLDSVLHFVGPKPEVFRSGRFCEYNYIIGCDSDASWNLLMMPCEPTLWSITNWARSRISFENTPVK